MSICSQILVALFGTGFFRKIHVRHMSINYFSRGSSLFSVCLSGQEPSWVSLYWSPQEEPGNGRGCPVCPSAEHDDRSGGSSGFRPSLAYLVPDRVDRFSAPDSRAPTECAL